MKRTLDLRFSPPVALEETGDKPAPLETGAESLRKKYDEAKRLNDFFKNQVVLKLPVVPFLNKE